MWKGTRRRLYLKTQNLKNSEKMIKAAPFLHILLERFSCCSLAQPSSWVVYVLTPPLYELLPFATTFSRIQPYEEKIQSKSRKETETMYEYINPAVSFEVASPAVPVQALNTFWCLHFSLHYESISFPHFLASSFGIFIILMQIFPPTTITSPCNSSFASSSFQSWCWITDSTNQFKLKPLSFYMKWWIFDGKIFIE